MAVPFRDKHYACGIKYTRLIQCKILILTAHLSPFFLGSVDVCKQND